MFLKQDFNLNKKPLALWLTFSTAKAEMEQVR